MTAPNHALTGAAIGLVFGDPLLAVPLAVVSHFVCDAIPHYDPPGPTPEAHIGSRQFIWVQLVGGAIGCAVIVGGLALGHPAHWKLAAWCAFAAASPDLLSVQRFISVKQRGKDIWQRNWFWRFHHRLQWKTGPRLWMVEAVWAAAMFAAIQANS